MISFPRDLLARLGRLVEAAYPNEACGLLIGRLEAGRVARVSRLEASPNLAPEPRHRFEIDLRLWFDLKRQLQGGGEAIVGLYHSHPDGLARPSTTDFERAWEPQLIWVIQAVAKGRAGPVSAHVLVGAPDRFEEIPLQPIGEAEPAGGGFGSCPDGEFER